MRLYQSAQIPYRRSKYGKARLPPQVQARPETSAVKHYQIQEGDTLSSIAKKFYDDASKYMVIYEANKDTIGADPNLIKVEQELKIPAH
ncbi:MAG TPA: LysM peptidoglycan-binding domain-containing protein [Chloroflexi bacterium]|nr:MAG: hypothetical protein DRI46_06085 [Chloroflexota bacterium]HDD55797.1 LysM peptidoglycan-binding domain-containing protein [Chloroflexota bacterium]